MSSLSHSRVAVIGCTGFVGGTLMDHLPNADGFNSKNIEDIADKAYDIIICAGLPATKWWINQHPDEDLANLERLQKTLAKADCVGQFVLISTIDVHDISQPDDQDEERVIPANHAYGKHRLMMEAWVKTQYSGKWRILRLPGLFGIGLKKNIIFDLLNDNMVDNISVNHEFQWYDLRHLVEDVDMACGSKGAGTCNLYSEPVGVGKMIQSVFPEFWERLKNNKAPNPIFYAIKSSRAPFGWVRSKEQVLQEMMEFVDVYRKMSAGRGRLLSVSNLAWTLEQESHALGLLRKYSIGNLEIAPTRYGKWDDDTVDFDAVRAGIAHVGLRIYSTQAVFFGLTTNIFDDPGAFEAHMRRVIELTSRLGAKRIVLGSPKNRAVPVIKGEDGGTCPAYQQLAQQVLERIGKFAEQNFPEVIVCLEPNSKKYGCNFVTTLKEAFELVEGVGSSNIGINLDTGNAEMEEEDVAAVLNACGPELRMRVKHIQVSRPFLEAMDSAPRGDLPKTLRGMFPDHIISLEMKEVGRTVLPRCLFNLYKFV